MRGVARQQGGVEEEGVSELASRGRYEPKRRDNRTKPYNRERHDPYLAKVRADWKRSGSLLVCHLCGQPIDPECASPDPQSLSVDHIIPVSQFSEADAHKANDLYNLAPAHRGCNSRKGNREYKKVDKKGGGSSRRW